MSDLGTVIPHPTPSTTHSHVYSMITIIELPQVQLLGSIQKYLLLEGNSWEYCSKNGFSLRMDFRVRKYLYLLKNIKTTSKRMGFFTWQVCVCVWGESET